MTAQMQPGSRILQYLTFRPNASFDEPVNPDGRLWDSALKHVTQSQGWSNLDWGRRLESKDVVDLLIRWRSHPDLQHFMTHNYRPFLSALEPLLLLDGPSNPTPPPYIHNLHRGMPSVEPGAVSSIYELAFSPDLDANIKIGLHIETQMCLQNFSKVAEEIDDGDLFHSFDAVWVEQYYPVLSSSPSSTAPDSVIEMKQDGETQQKTLLVIAEWASQDGEKIVSDRDGMEKGGIVLTAGEYFAKFILQRASSYKKHQVVFENMWNLNVK